MGKNRDLFELAQEKVYQNATNTRKGRVDQNATYLKMTPSLRDPNWIPLPDMKG